jgi:hypothetical protein
MLEVRACTNLRSRLDGFSPDEASDFPHGPRVATTGRVGFWVSPVEGSSNWEFVELILYLD